MGRSVSAFALVSLWVLFIVMSIMQSSNIAGIGDSGWGIDLDVKNPNMKCN